MPRHSSRAAAAADRLLLVAAAAVTFILLLSEVFPYLTRLLRSHLRRQTAARRLAPLRPPSLRQHHRPRLVCPLPLPRHLTRTKTSSREMHSPTPHLSESSKLSSLTTQSLPEEISFVRRLLLLGTKNKIPIITIIVNMGQGYWPPVCFLPTAKKTARQKEVQEEPRRVKRERPPRAKNTRPMDALEKNKRKRRTIKQQRQALRQHWKPHPPKRKVLRLPARLLLLQDARSRLCVRIRLRAWCLWRLRRTNITPGPRLLGQPPLLHLLAVEEQQQSRKKEE